MSSVAGSEKGYRQRRVLRDTLERHPALKKTQSELWRLLCSTSEGTHKNPAIRENFGTKRDVKK